MAELIEFDEIKILNKLDSMLKEHPDQIISPDEKEMKRAEQLLIGVEIDNDA